MIFSLFYFSFHDFFLFSNPNFEFESKINKYKPCFELNLINILIQRNSSNKLLSNGFGFSSCVAKSETC